MSLPTSTKDGINGRNNKGGNNGDGILSNHGIAMSSAPIGIRMNQLPNPPITADTL